MVEYNKLITADDQIVTIPYAPAHGTGAFGSSLKEEKQLWSEVKSGLSQIY